MKTSIELPALVGGDLVAGTDWISRENPAFPDHVVGRVAACTDRDVELAVSRAGRAFESWRRRSVDDRAALLDGAIGQITAQHESLSDLLTSELGKVRADSAGELSFARAFATHCSAALERVMADHGHDDERGRLVIHQEPFGVVAAITPWNAPILLTMLKVIPALLTGNTIIVKPSPLVPLTITRALTLMAASLPPGVVSVLNGGAEVGSALSRHAGVSRVVFTGGGATARHILRNAAEHATPATLELGGNDPAIFLSDADLSPDVVARVVHGSFMSSAQVCMAAKRLYVHRSRADEFLDVYLEAARHELLVGDPGVEGVTMGPVVTRADAERIDQLVASAQSSGARVHRLGSLDISDETFATGYFVHPTLVTGLDEAHPLVTEEQFGPTVPMLIFDDEDELVDKLNRDELGLASSVWSADEDRAFALARQLRYGYTFINTHGRSGLDLSAPFGGFRGSGFGREFGDEGLREYLQPHSVHLPGGARAGEDFAGNRYPGQR